MKVAKRIEMIKYKMKLEVGGYMGRAETRKVKHGQETVAGSLERELDEIKKLQEAGAEDSMATITAGCDELLTILCC